MNQAIVRCQTCRFYALDSFITVARGTFQSSLQHHSRPKRRNIQPSSKHPFGSFNPRLTSDPVTPIQDDTTSTSKSSPPTPSSIPWYLQVETPEPPAPISPHLALQEIPPIPDDAPQILSPILSHLSTHVGLDNLTLLDLRSAHPPPALGANLLMILGTARSYKHLNTSADRFCRWLRSNYKLAPYADGLLGRNEMKLKLRRRARKMKLAQSVGNTVAMGSAEGGDDGITTGWVCVNVGSVDEVEVDAAESLREKDTDQLDGKEQEEIEAEEDEYENPPDNSGVIGFGVQDARPRIVVQMFTEEKRLEMDLEGLWSFRAQRREKKEEKLSREIADS